MADPDAPLLASQRPLSLDEARDILAPLGSVRSVRTLSGGTFSAVQAAELSAGDTVVIKTSVPVVPDELGRTPLLAYEHDMLRSERDILRIAATLDGVPAPHVLLEDFGRDRANVDVLVMSFVPGTPWDTVIRDMSPEANDRAAERVGEILGSMQQVTGSRFGYPAADFQLGADTWPEFVGATFDAVVADAAAWDLDIHADRVLAAVERGRDALAEVETPTLIHNDLWHGNVLLDPATGTVHGVVDFERALYADPLWDFVGAESMRTDASNPPMLRGYERVAGPLPRDASAGTATGFTPTADYRTTLYRLWSMCVQWVEIVPRGFSGDWLTAHRATIASNLTVLLERAERGY